MKDTRKQDLIKEIISLCGKGYSNEYIETFLKTKKVKAEDILAMMEEAEEQFLREYISNPQGVLSQHLLRYNENIEKLMQIDELDYSDTKSSVNELGDIQEPKISHATWLAARKNKIAAMNQLVDTLVQKENLLGLANRTTQVEITEDIDIEIKKPSRPQYDLSKLTFDQQVRMLRLMKKARGADQQQPGITIPERTVDARVIESITVEQPPNIEKIQIEKPPIPTPQDMTGSEKLQLALKKLAAKKLKDAGANLDPDEQKFLENE